MTEVEQDEMAIEQAQRERTIRIDPDSAAYQEGLRDEQRRMWCLSAAANLAVQLQRAAPNAETWSVMLAAEEMCEFIETGRARTPDSKAVSRRRQ